MWDHVVWYFNVDSGCKVVCDTAKQDGLSCVSTKKEKKKSVTIDRASIDMGTDLLAASNDFIRCCAVASIQGKTTVCVFCVFFFRKNSVSFCLKIATKLGFFFAEILARHCLFLSLKFCHEIGFRFL